MKKVMICLPEQTVKQILNGDQTVLIRTWRIKAAEIPCEVLIYKSRGNVVAKFLLNKIDTIVNFSNGTYLIKFEDFEKFLSDSCMTVRSLHRSYGERKWFYAWHIENLKIFQKQKILSSFYSSKKYIDGYIMSLKPFYKKLYGLQPNEVTRICWVGEM